MKLPKEYYDLVQATEELKYIDYDGKRIHVSDLKDRSVTTHMKNKMRMNSYAQSDMPPKLTDKALIETVTHYRKNCETTSSTPYVTYNDNLIHVLVPELVKRMNELIRENGILNATMDKTKQKKAEK
ncbi:hypothetical protein QU593_10220 [Rossellomorea marisflavi]|uniref:hypothetical protein n=1 Tax=Rossellomorea marisflavi TaxID=189381 RepID=UPI0025B21504|nr:hypothetical protein [Rossellomorea marisflavi]WJV20780.1 hypothetical protein QU593_10220 [Rossellomorea marisflavi]